MFLLRCQRKTRILTFLDKVQSNKRSALINVSVSKTVYLSSVLIVSLLLVLAIILLNIWWWTGHPYAALLTQPPKLIHCHRQICIKALKAARVWIVCNYTRQKQLSDEYLSSVTSEEN